MLETLVNPKKAERKPWEMLFIGILYAALSVLIIDFIFLKDPVFKPYISILIVTFTVMFSIPFMFYIIKLEEEKDLKIKNERALIKEHGKAISALMFLFLGYVIAFSFMYIIMPRDTSDANFKIQVETYCSINARGNYERCISNYMSGKAIDSEITGSVTRTRSVPGIKEGMGRVATILSNNFYVLLFSLLFSFLFGAGAIFILAWNASVISTAVGIFANRSLGSFPLGLARYLIHGIPEIASYFIVALAGGIIGTAIIRHEFGHKKFWHVLQDSLDLVILALVVLIISAFIEVFITPIVI